MQNNLFLEMLPVGIFFIVYYITHNIYLSTGILIIASWLLLLWYKIKYTNISKNIWLSTTLITLFGGLTIILHNKTFVMLKPTVLYWIVGGAMLIGQVMGKNAIKLILNKEINVTDSVWNKLNIAWGTFFLLLGVANLFVALNFSEYVWVKFKVFGTFGIMLLFMLITVLCIFITQKKNHNA